MIALQRGDPTTAERLIREALAAKPTLRLAHFNLALLAEQRGDVRTAEREYVDELKQHPENYKAAFNLSRLYEQVGDREGQIDALKQSIVSNPRFAEGHLFLAKAYLDSETNLDEAGQAGAQRARAGAHGRSTRRSDTTCWPTSTTGRGARAEGAQELARGRALEAVKRKGGESNVRRILNLLSVVLESSSVRQTSPDVRAARRSAPYTAP